jgi:hypothetical protein
VTPGTPVTFTLNNVTDPAECEVTESGGPAGYFPSFDNQSSVSDTSCVFDPVHADNLYACDITNVARVNPYLTITVSGQSTDTTPVPEGPAGVFSFTSTYCNKAGSPTLESLVSRTRVLTNDNVLINRDRDGSGTPPGGVGSELDFPLDPDYDDGQLAAGECVDVSYEIGLTQRSRFKFNVDLLGSVVSAP